MRASIRNSTDVHITGATGYLGRELLRLVPGASAERVELRDGDAVHALLGRVRPKTVIHTAYRQEDPSVNVEGSEHVAHAAAVVGARLVHLSSDVVFDGLKGEPYVEDDPLSPVNSYAESKAEAERLVATAHPEALIVRTSLIVGGAQPSAQPSKHELRATGPGPWFTNEIRSPIQVNDLAHALLELAELDVGGPLHVAGADGVSRAELAELIAGRPVTTAEAPPGRPLDCRLDSSRAQSLLRTRLRGVRELFGRER
jgi:dTDP-4-dehydrorhamnose reductase